MTPQFNLLPYQEALVSEFILHAGRILYHVDVGLGKTRTAMAAMYAAKAERFVIVTTAAVKEQTAREAVTCGYDESEVVVMGGTKAARRKMWEAVHTGSPKIIIMNYELLCNDIEEVMKYAPDGLVIDECQRLSNPRNLIHKQLKKLNPLLRIAMSATPAKNALYELYPTLSWVRPEVYGTNFYLWRGRNCKMHPVIPGRIVGYYNEDQVRRDFAGYTLRLKRDGVIELPPLSHQTLYAEMTEDEKKRYKQLKESLILEVAGQETVTVPNLLALMLRLRQVADAPQVFGLTEVSSKQAVLGDLLESTLSGGMDRVIVFVIHTSVAKALKDLYGGEVYDGSLSGEQREAVLGAFKAGTRQVLYMTAAGQAGLNITEAQCVIHYQLPYTYADMEQREGRIWRMGQTKGCVAYTVLMKGSVDMQVKRIVEGKKALTVESLMEAVK